MKCGLAPTFLWHSKPVICQSWRSALHSHSPPDRIKAFFLSLKTIGKKKLENVGNTVPFTTALNLLNARVSQDMEFDEFPNCGQDLLDNKFYGQSVNNVEGK